MAITDYWLFLPLLICLGSVAAAALGGLPALKQRIPNIWLGWLLALAPLGAFLMIAAHAGQVIDGGRVVQEIAWMPSLGASAALYLDGLSALFALMVTGIGTLVVIYTGYYLNKDPDTWKFLAYTMLFMTSMLGLVLAGDIITLFVFWEGTSITSFLLIGFKQKDAAARKSAFKALFITGAGGIALLAGLLLTVIVSGSFAFVDILASGDVLRESPLYLAMLGLLILASFTKSAQVPFHIWLPDAMSAPTPASAYLHSATMVKAGIYLMARMNPVMGLTEAWFWMLSLAGLATMLTGAFLGLKQNDLKALLAYSTVSQLGVLIMLIGQDSEIAFKALVVGLLAHALYKSALFMIAGIVDHETGTRDLRRLGGIRRAMPITFSVTFIAALSMGGLPPLFGFLAKETLLATTTHPGVPQIIEILFPAAVVISGALILVQAGLLLVDTFMGEKRDDSIHAHEAPLGMILAPMLPAVFSLALGILPEPPALAALLAAAAQAAFGEPVKVSLALWTGINVPLLLSMVAIITGASIFALRIRIRSRVMEMGNGLTANKLYHSTLSLIDRAAYWVTLVQNGKLRFYLVIMLGGIGGLILWFNALPALVVPRGISLAPDLFTSELMLLRFFSLLLIVITAAASVFLQRDLPAILALGVSGLAVAVLMVLEPAPDVALVQVVVDILLTIIMVLLLTRLPRPQRQRADEFTFRQSRPGLLRDGLIALGSGIVMTVLVFSMLASRPRQSLVTPYYEDNAKVLAGATDIVGAIIVSFRAFDTLIEIAVFGMGGIGVYTLLRYASRKAGDKEEETVHEPSSQLPTLGIGGLHVSPFVRLLAYMILPLTLVVSITHILYGHDQPGDGFTAGIMISLAVGLWYVVFGYRYTKRRLAWLKSTQLIGAGLLLVLTGATISALVNGSFFSQVSLTDYIDLPLPRGFYLNTGLLFELAICLTVLGSASLVIDTLGRPKDADRESTRQVEAISTLEKLGLVTRDEDVLDPTEE
ncbi:MAG: hydrogen gas-evolving membrane-bound hydrogenase subunit E [Anaerolineales bacterium]|jgi:NADH:ubiquinone oxidoreductase subunit 5 (subunit L)/multisubunit Na+/H+ antiporter MnhA subunit/multisubunit Na+/H+ antiporter MnhB subunit